MLLDEELDKEYAGIMGFETFRKAAVQLAFGPGFDFIENGTVSTVVVYNGRNKICQPLLKPRMDQTGNHFACAYSKLL